MTMFLRTLADNRPAGRGDGVSWTGARVEERVGSTGEGAQLAVFGFAPDADPAVPATHTFTFSTEAETAWYRVVFTDEAGNEDPTAWTYYGGPGYVELPPSTTTLRFRSRLLRQMFPAEPFDEAAEEDLQGYLDDAVALVQAATCRVLDPTLTDPNLRRLAERAVVLMAEYVTMGAQPELAGKTAEGKRLRSISAGPWSESYFAPGELTANKDGRPKMHADDRLDTVLWALATPECREQFIADASAVDRAAGVVSAFDYRRMGGGISGSGIAHPDRW
jgi:hypothetical protein